MTRDRARKKAVRARMAASGEPYTTAARRLDAADPAEVPAEAGDQTAAGDQAATTGPAVAAEIADRASRTLAERRARVETRMDRAFTPPPTWTGPRLPGPVSVLARRAAGVAWRRISPEKDWATARDEMHTTLLHQLGEGFVEPAADRYQIDFGAYAELHAEGEYYGGRSGQPLKARYRQEPPGQVLQEPLAFLRKLSTVTNAGPAGHETVRGTRCRGAVTRVDSIDVTVWFDEEHIRRVRFESDRPDGRGSVSEVRVLELWDFGFDGEPADWDRLPQFRPSPFSAGSGPA
jgi:hypothetical protein